MKLLSKVAVAVVGASMFAGAAYAVPMTDVQDYITTGGNSSGTTYWLDDDANKFDDPYYRSPTEDWGWEHNAIAGTFTSASLAISAFDVDTPSEIDNISIYNTATASWVTLGTLTGSSDVWSFGQVFDLTPLLAGWVNDEINAGLQVAIDISVGSSSWWVTLSKSVLSVDGGSQQCVPTPGVPCTPGGGVPEPAPVALFGLGLVAIVASRRLRNRR